MTPCPCLGHKCCDVHQAVQQVYLDVRGQTAGGYAVVGIRQVAGTMLVSPMYVSRDSTSHRPFKSAPQWVQLLCVTRLLGAAVWLQRCESVSVWSRRPFIRRRSGCSWCRPGCWGPPRGWAPEEACPKPPLRLSEPAVTQQYLALLISQQNFYSGQKLRLCLLVNQHHHIGTTICGNPWHNLTLLGISRVKAESGGVTTCSCPA